MLIYAFILLVAICAYPWWRYRHARLALSDLPSLPSLAVVGNVHQLMGDGVHLLTRLTIVSKTMDYQRSPLVFWLGPIPILGVCDPIDIKAVTNAYAKKSSADSELVWNHAFFRPALFSTKVEDCQDIFNSQGRKLVDHLKTQAGKEAFDLNLKYVGWSTLGTMFEITFGMPTTELTKDNFEAISRASEVYMGRMINVPFLLSLLYGLAPASKDLAKDEIVLKNLVEKMINKTITGDTTRIWLNKDILQSRKKMTTVLTTMLGAGHQTLSNVLSMALVIIGSHSTVQDRLYQEIKTILGDRRNITSQDLAEMKYCEAVIFETLRLYPHVPLYFLHADKTLELSKCTIPEDTTCWINVWGAGRSRDVWGADTDVFRPERWLEGQDHVDHSGLIAFYLDNLTGFGMQASLAMLKTTLAQCIKELTIQSNTRNLRFKMSTVLQPINGNLLRVQLRE